MHCVLRALCTDPVLSKNSTLLKVPEIERQLRRFPESPLYTTFVVVAVTAGGISSRGANGNPVLFVYHSTLGNRRGSHTFPLRECVESIAGSSAVLPANIPIAVPPSDEAQDRCHLLRLGKARMSLLESIRLWQ